MFHAMLFFLYHIKTKEHGMLRYCLCHNYHTVRYVGVETGVSIKQAVVHNGAFMFLFVPLIYIGGGATPVGLHGYMVCCSGW